MTSEFITKVVVACPYCGGEEDMPYRASNIVRASCRHCGEEFWCAHPPDTSKPPSALTREAFDQNFYLDEEGQLRLKRDLH